MGVNDDGGTLGCLDRVRFDIVDAPIEIIPRGRSATRSKEGNGEETNAYCVLCAVLRTRGDGRAAMLEREVTTAPSPATGPRELVRARRARGT